MVSNGFGIHGSSVAVRCVSAGRLRLGPSTGPGILEDGVERVALLGGTGVREGKILGAQRYGKPLLPRAISSTMRSCTRLTSARISSKLANVLQEAGNASIMKMTLYIAAVLPPMGIMSLCGCGSEAASGADAAVPSCPEDELTPCWSVMMAGGVEGSPTVCDLDGDGRLEALVPISVFDQPDKSYLIALDAITGSLVWQSAMGGASYSYPYCVDVNGDGVEDLLVGGRTMDVAALSGVDGERLWSLAQTYPDEFPGNDSSGNTSSVAGASIEAQTLFVSAGGGNSHAPGRLLALRPDGSLLQTWFEPANQLVYSSPAVVRLFTGELLVAIGSGGEKSPGRLHWLQFDESTDRFSYRAGIASACLEGGFIASPMWGDLTGDALPELVGTDFCGGVHAVSIDGSRLWSYADEVLYGTANPLLADLTGDGTFDVVAAFHSFNFSIPETWERVTSAVVVLHGLTGDLLWRTELSTILFASPISADFDLDGVEDVWLVGTGLPNQESEFTVLSGTSGELLYTKVGGGGFGTPVLGDFDRNGSIDVLFTEMESVEDPVGPGHILRMEFPDRPYTPTASFSGFRGIPVHSGHRPSPP